MHFHNAADVFHLQINARGKALNFLSAEGGGEDAAKEALAQEMLEKHNEKRISQGTSPVSCLPTTHLDFHVGSTACHVLLHAMPSFIIYLGLVFLQPLLDSQGPKGTNNSTRQYTSTWLQTRR